MRGLVFVLGALGGAWTLGALTWGYPGIWLPLALGCLVGALLLRFPPLAKHPLTPPYVAAFVLLVTNVWLRSGPMSPRRSAQGVSGLLLVLLVLALAWLALRFLRCRPAERRLMVPYAAMLLLACIVASLSGDAGGASPMTGWLRTVLGLSEAGAEVAVIVFRKTVHFTFYGLYAWVALRAALLVEDDRRASAGLALALALTLAAFDEFRQVGAPGRTGSIWDVALDMVGAATVVALTLRRVQPPERSDGTLQ